VGDSVSFYIEKRVFVFDGSGRIEQRVEEIFVAAKDCDVVISTYHLSLCDRFRGPERKFKIEIVWQKYL